MSTLVVFLWGAWLGALVAFYLAYRRFKVDHEDAADMPFCVWFTRDYHFRRPMYVNPLDGRSEIVDD